MSKDREAYALYNRAVEYSDALEEELGGKSASAVFQPVLEASKKVASMARIGRCVTHARAIEVGSDPSGEAAATQAAAQATKQMLDHLDDATSFAGARGRKVFGLPPTPKSVACQPFLLDTAVDHIQYPQIPAELTLNPAGKGADAKGSGILGGVTSMFGWKK